jgi:hypothetical protein
MSYRDDSLSIRPSARFRSQLRAELLAKGYTSLQVRYDSGIQRYVTEVTLGGVTRPMTVSTVALINVDTQFAKAAGIEPGAVAGSYGGPTRSQGQYFKTSEPIVIQIGTWKSSPISNANIRDVYAYSKKTRPLNFNAMLGGALGADFLVPTEAVVDFGDACLYLGPEWRRRQPRSGARDRQEPGEIDVS